MLQRPMDTLFPTHYLDEKALTLVYELQCNQAFQALFQLLAPQVPAQAHLIQGIFQDELYGYGHRFLGGMISFLLLHHLSLYHRAQGDDEKNFSYIIVRELNIYPTFHHLTYR